jgi:hypothetical protein
MYWSKSSLRPASSSWSISAGRYSSQDVDTSTTPGSATAATNGLLAGVGGIAVRGEDVTRRHPPVAISYGTGLALIVNEFALLLDLRGVYWLRQGQVSVDLGIGVVALGGTALAAGPMLRRPARPFVELFGGRDIRRPPAKRSGSVAIHGAVGLPPATVATTLRGSFHF